MIMKLTKINYYCNHQYKKGITKANDEQSKVIKSSIRDALNSQKGCMTSSSSGLGKNVTFSNDALNDNDDDDDVTGAFSNNEAFDEDELFIEDYEKLEKELNNKINFLENETSRANDTITKLQKHQSSSQSQSDYQ